MNREALDPQFEREQQKNEKQAEYHKRYRTFDTSGKRETFATFCERQRQRIRGRWDRAVVRVAQAQSEEDVFENRR